MFQRIALVGLLLADLGLGLIVVTEIRPYVECNPWSPLYATAYCGDF